MDNKFIGIIVIVVAYFALLAFGRQLDVWSWNGGRCRKHGRSWLYFDTDSQGGRGYKCEEQWQRTEPDGHNRVVGLTCCTWISWPWVDDRKVRA